MSSDPVRELLDFAAVHSFYMALLEEHLGHALPVPQEAVHGLGAEACAAQSVEALRRWLSLLDLAVTAPMVRDGLKRSTTSETAEALLRYFVGKRSGLASDRDKADFVATFLYRCFAPGPPLPPVPDEARRPADYDDEAPTAKAPPQPSPFEQELQRVLGTVQILPLPEEHRQLAREFHFIALEVADFRHFDELMDSGVMPRLRQVKKSFGPSFYHPLVLANAAEYNVFFGVRFDELFRETTRHLKSYAARVQEEGGSIMSRVEGDIILKHLAEVEEEEIMGKEYAGAQDAFRQVSKMKKAVDSRTKRGGPGAAATAAPERVAPPVPGGRNTVEENRLRSTQGAIHDFVHAAEPGSARVVPLPQGDVMLTTAEAEAFRTDYGNEKSFRADFAALLRRIVGLQARMIIELVEYRTRRSSAYHWKPHADSLAYLLRAAEGTIEASAPLLASARQRGLTQKADALNSSLQKLRSQREQAAKALAGAG